MCAHVRQTSVPNIAGLSSNQESIRGTDRSLYGPSGRPKCPDTQISSKREDIRILLGPFLAKIMFFGSFLKIFFKKIALGFLATHEKLRQLSWHHKEDIFLISSPERNICNAVTHAQPNQNPEKPRF